MKIHIILAALSVFFGFAGAFPYLFDIAKKRARPNIVSWGGWGMLTGIGTAAQFAKGAGLSVVVPLYSTLNTLLVITLSLRSGHVKFNLLDKVCFALGMLAIVAWVTTHDPLVALILVVIADCILAIPTIVKTYKNPRSETPLPWILWGFSALFGLLSLSAFNLANVLYPAWLLGADTAVGLLALRRGFRKM